MSERLSGSIANALEELIIAGDFVDGERLDEVRLAEHFDVSRTPLREALQQLGASGLVELRPRRGAFVHMPQAHELAEMFEVMAELEALAGRHAARRMTDEAIVELKRFAADCEAAIADSDAYYAANETFHHAIYDGSGNGFLASQAKQLHRRLQPFRRLQLQVRGRLQQSMKEHLAIIAAIEAGDADAAADALRDHVRVQNERFSDLAASYRIRSEPARKFG